MAHPRRWLLALIALLAIVGGASEQVFHPLPQDDPTQRQPVIDLAGQILGWAPQVGLDEGLVRTIDYFRSDMQDTSSLPNRGHAALTD